MGGKGDKGDDIIGCMGGDILGCMGVKGDVIIEGDVLEKIFDEIFLIIMGLPLFAVACMF